MSINEEINKAIQNNLPAATAAELAKYIEKAEAAFTEVQDINRRLDKITKDRDRLIEDIGKFRKDSDVHGDLKKRENEVGNRENNLQVLIFQIKMEEAEKRADGIHKLAATVFRNRSMTRQTSFETPVFTPTMGGGGYHNMQKGTSTTREVEIDG